MLISVKSNSVRFRRVLAWLDTLDSGLRRNDGVRAPYSRLVGHSGFRPRIGVRGKLYAGMTVGGWRRARSILRIMAQTLRIGIRIPFLSPNPETVGPRWLALSPLSGTHVPQTERALCGAFAILSRGCRDGRRRGPGRVFDYEPATDRMERPFDRADVGAMVRIAELPDGGLADAQPLS